MGRSISCSVLIIWPRTLAAPSGSARRELPCLRSVDGFRIPREPLQSRRANGEGASKFVATEAVVRVAEHRRKRKTCLGIRCDGLILDLISCRAQEARNRLSCFKCSLDDDRWHYPPRLGHVRRQGPTGGSAGGPAGTARGRRASAAGLPCCTESP